LENLHRVDGCPGEPASGTCCPSLSCHRASRTDRHGTTKSGAGNCHSTDCLHGEPCERFKQSLRVSGPTPRCACVSGNSGSNDDGVDRYVEVSQQHTVVEDDAKDVVSLFRDAGFRVDRVRDVDAWLQRYAVFIKAIAGALYEKDCDARRLAADSEAVVRFIRAVREG
jgi:ketopantoate reductase